MTCHLQPLSEPMPDNFMWGMLSDKDCAAYQRGEAVCVDIRPPGEYWPREYWIWHDFNTGKPCVSYDPPKGGRSIPQGFLQQIASSGLRLFTPLLRWRRIQRRPLHSPRRACIRRLQTVPRKPPRTRLLRRQTQVQGRTERQAENERTTSLIKTTAIGSVVLSVAIVVQ